MSQHNDSGESSKTPTDNPHTPTTAFEAPSCLKDQGSQDIPFPTSWGVHADVTKQMQHDGCWGAVQKLAEAAYNLFVAGTAFQRKIGSLWPGCFDEMTHEEHVLRYKMKSGGEMHNWHESMAILHRAMVGAFFLFLNAAKDNGLEYQVVKAFNAHKSLGFHGDGVVWWKSNVETLLEESKVLLMQPTTMEGWYRGGSIWVNCPNLQEIQVYADVLDDDLERGEGITPVERLVFVLKRDEPGILKRRAEMTWASKRMLRCVRNE